MDWKVINNIFDLEKSYWFITDTVTALIYLYEFFMTRFQPLTMDILKWKSGHADCFVWAALEVFLVTTSNASDDYNVTAFPFQCLFLNALGPLLLTWIKFIPSMDK